MKLFAALTLALATACVGVAGAAPAVRTVEASTPARQLDIYFVDVEGGAATLIVTPAGESILVDSGWPREDGRDAKRIEQVARYTAGLKQIDHYITTHWHTDHYGGIEYLARLMPVKHYWDHGIPAAAQDDSKDFPELMAAYKRSNGGRSSALKAGDHIPLKSAGLPVSLTVVSANGKVIGEGSKAAPVSCARHGAPPTADESDNMRSVGLLFKCGDFSFLNLGDLTWNIEHKLSCPRNRVGKVDLWQVTHHGWEASSNPALVEATRPRVAVMVNGARKGASASVVRMIKKAPSIQALYQLHTNVTTGPDDNTSVDKVANVDENCKAEFFRVSLSPDGSRYTVFKGAGKPLQTFQVR